MLYHVFFEEKKRESRILRENARKMNEEGCSILVAGGTLSSILVEKKSLERKK